MYAENEPAIKRNEAVLNELPCELYTKDANDKISFNCKYSLTLIQDVQNQKQTNTGGLAKFLQLKIDAKVMLKVNIDIQDRLINGQTGIIRHTEFAQGIAREVYIKLSDEQAGSKAMRSSCLSRQNSWVSIEKCETEISIKKGSASPSIKRTPLTLAWAPTVLKVQGLSFEQGVTDFDWQKQKSFGLGQMYTVLSRVKTYYNLYCIGEFKKSAIMVNKDALLEYECLKQNDLFSTVKQNAVSGNTVTVLVHNVRSLARHVDDVFSNKTIINNDITGFIETQIKPSDFSCKIIEMLNLFNINFNNNEHKFSSLAYGCRNDVDVLSKFDADGLST